MSYNTTVRGTIKISPPLRTRDLRGHTNLTDDERYAYVKVTERVKETEDGDLIIKEATEVYPYEEDWSPWGLDEQLQEIVDAFPDHEFTGHFECTGEDGERWRLVIRDRKVVEVRPKITWDE